MTKYPFPKNDHLFDPREILDIMEFRLGGLYLQEMRDLRGGGATLAEVVKHFPKYENNGRSYPDSISMEICLGGGVLLEEGCGDEAAGEEEGTIGGTS